jgi:hypothetical protein
MATNYQRGRQFEYRTRDKLLKMGAAYVMRAASSKGAADLIALWAVPRSQRADAVWVIQAKRDGKLPRKEREALLAIARIAPVARPVLAKTGPDGRGVVFIDLNDMEVLPDGK